MTKFEKKLDHAKEKVAGGVKEASGKITGNEQLELKGKMQSSKADFKKDMDIGDRIEDANKVLQRTSTKKLTKNEKKTRNASKLKSETYAWSNT